MGTDPRSNVKPGDRLRIAAEQINFLNGLMRPDTGFKGPALPGYESGRNVILARNSSGGDLDRWGVLAITGIEINPTEGETKRRSFEEMPCIVGTMPTATTGAAFCIAVEPIKADKIGRVVVAGVVQAKLNVSSSSDAKLLYAKPHASRDTLKASRSGPARILWKPPNVSGTSLWGLIRIDDNGGAQLRIGKTTSLWAKNSLASIPLYEQGTPPSETTSDETLTDVVNHWGDVPANKWVGIMSAANGYNYLVVAEC